MPRVTLPRLEFGSCRSLTASPGRLVAAAVLALACGWACGPAAAEELPAPDGDSPGDAAAARRMIEEAISQTGRPGDAAPRPKPASAERAAAISAAPAIWLVNTCRSNVNPWCARARTLRRKTGSAATSGLAAKR
jgi:hypothetical protein